MSGGGSMNIAVIFYRTLSSQSAASVSAGYIASNLRRLGHNVSLFLLKKEASSGDIAPIISGIKWDIIFYKPNFKDVDRLEYNISDIRKNFPNSKIILFGPLAYINANQILKKYPSIAGILNPDMEASWTNTSDIFETLTTKTHTYFSSFTKDVDIYRCLPARDIEISENLKIANIEASRWCKNYCSFCHVGLISKLAARKVYTRTPEDVVNEILYLKSIGKKYFIFNDPVLCGGGLKIKTWVKKFAQLLKNNPDIFFMAYLTLNDLTDKYFIKTLQEAGFIRVFVGIESAEKETLSAFHKAINVNNYHELKKELKFHGIVPHIGFMVFHPYVNIEEIRANLTYLYENDEIHRFGVIYEPTRVIYNTPLYFQTLRDGLLTSTDGIKFSYSFYDKQVQKIFNSFRQVFNDIDVPLLERIEYLFVTAEFIDNFIYRNYTPTDEYEKHMNQINTYRKQYSTDFLKLCLNIIEGKVINTQEEHKKYFTFWQILENFWHTLIISAQNIGFDNPLEWIASGNCNPEPIKDKNYTGRCLETRSGRIRV